MDRYRRPEDLSRIESEAGIIATLIHHPEFVFHSEELMPEHFTNVQNQVMYEALRGMAEEHVEKIDAFGIMQYIEHHDPANSSVLNKDDLEEFIAISPSIERYSSKDYKILVSNVYDVAFRREMILKMKQCENILLNHDGDDIRKRIYDEIDGVMTSYSYADDIEEYLDKLDGLWSEIKSRQGDGYSGIPFKFPLLNEYVTIERGELVIFGAQQKVGKSIMLLNCAVDLIKRGYSVLYIDSELSDRLFTARLLAHLTGIEYKALTAGRYEEGDAQKIADSIAWLKQQKFQHIYMPTFDGESMYRTVKRVHHTMPLDVLIVDYFKSTGNEMDAFQTYATMGKVTDTVKNELAGKLNIAAIGAAQATATNRLADSAKIARNASTIIMLIDKTPEELATDGEKCGNKKMIVTVNRNGMQHAEGEYISLNFDGNHILYEQAQEQATPPSPFE